MYKSESLDEKSFLVWLCKNPFCSVAAGVSSPAPLKRDKVEESYLSSCLVTHIRKSNGALCLPSETSPLKYDGKVTTFW